MTGAICIIPARGGSKRIPGKNIKRFHGRPMLTYALEAAILSGAFETIIVSTDDPEVAAVAARATEHLRGKILVTERPAHLADDHATTGQVMAFEMKDWPPDTIACCLYPCTPMTGPGELRHAVATARAGIGKRPYLMPVTRINPPMQRALRRDDYGHLEPVWGKFEKVRSQDLEPRWRDAGQWYIARARTWCDPRIPLYANATGLEVPAWQAVDIDTQEDWEIAEAMYAYFERKIRG